MAKRTSTTCPFNRPTRRSRPTSTANTRRRSIMRAPAKGAAGCASCSPAAWIVDQQGRPWQAGETTTHQPTKRPQPPRRLFRGGRVMSRDISGALQAGGRRIGAGTASGRDLRRPEGGRLALAEDRTRVDRGAAAAAAAPPLDAEPWAQMAAAGPAAQPPLPAQVELPTDLRPAAVYALDPAVRTRQPFAPADHAAALTVQVELLTEQPGVTELR